MIFSFYFIFFIMANDRSPIFIEKNEIKRIGKIIDKIYNEKKIFKICKLIKKIDKINKDRYKYGSCWIDEFFMKINIIKLNKILEEYYIIIF